MDEMVMQERKKHKKLFAKIVLPVSLFVVLTFICLLIFGITPLGKHLQSVEWVRKIAKVFCS